jgi:hypothetical protein
MSRTIQDAVNELVTAPRGSCIELHRPTGFYQVFKDGAGSIWSQCRDSKGKLHPPQRETPQFAKVGKLP